MRYLSWVAKGALFLLILSFAVVNTDPVTVRYYLGQQWQAPLVLVLLVALCAGAALGLLVGLVQALKLRRRIAALERELQVLRRPPAPPLPPSDLL
jgi:uncharacterized integral membrane protein